MYLVYHQPLTFSIRNHMRQGISCKILLGIHCRIHFQCSYHRYHRMLIRFQLVSSLWTPFILRLWLICSRFICSLRGSPYEAHSQSLFIYSFYIYIVPVTTDILQCFFLQILGKFFVGHNTWQMQQNLPGPFLGVCQVDTPLERRFIPIQSLTVSNAMRHYKHNGNESNINKKIEAIIENH